jgi:hypothetical protein
MIRNATSTRRLQLQVVLKVGFAILIALELIGPFVANSYGPDGGFHLYWIREFTRLNDQGIFFPRWIPDGFSGFGSPAFYFYPPLTYYLASLVHIISGLSDPAALFQAVSLLATLGSIFTARVLLRSLGTTTPQIWLGSALYAFAPYQIGEIYSLSSLSSHVAFVFLPLVWCGLIQIFRSSSPSRKGLLLFAIAFALMTLSNIPVTALTIVTILIAALIFRHEFSIRNTTMVVVGFGLAALLTSFYLISILSYLPYVQISYLSEQREFFFDDLLHFSNLPGLYHLALLYGALAVLIRAYLHIHRSKEKITIEERSLLRMGMVMTILLLVLEIPPIGRPVLSSVPMINLIQGTWRFYLDVVLLVSCVIGIARSEPLRQAGTQIIWIWLVGAIFCMIPILLHFHFSQHQETHLMDPPEYAPIYTLKNHDSLETCFSHFTNIGPIMSDSNIDGSTITLNRNSAEQQEYILNARRPMRVTFHRFYWPAWHLYASDREIISHPDSLGLTTAVLPAGNYTATWQLERTPLERAGLWISGIAWAGLILMWGIGLGHRRFKKGSSPL